MSTTTEQSIIDRSLLEARLASLIGFDDTSDIFDHLISIDTPQHIKEYLSELLGSNSSSVRNFATDVGKWIRGDPIQRIDDDKFEEKKEEKKVVELDYSAAATAPKYKTPSNNRAAARTKKQNQKLSKITEQRSKRLNNTKRKPPPPKKKNPIDTTLQKKAVPLAPSAPVFVPKAAVAVKTPPQPTPTAKTRPTEPRLPPRGEAKTVCGCYGTRHDALTNCLHCGRIACEAEGYGYCGFCGFLIEKIVVTASSSNGKKDRALEHKERLLQFDKESAQRTKVYDDQEDYFSNAKSKWLTEEEQMEAEEKEKIRRRDLLGRKKAVLNIAF